MILSYTTAVPGMYVYVLFLPLHAGVRCGVGARRPSPTTTAGRNGASAPARVLPGARG